LNLNVLIIDLIASFFTVDVTIKKIHLDLKLAIAKECGKTLKGLEIIFKKLDKKWFQQT